MLAEMRAAEPRVHYLVGTPKGRLTRLEKQLTAQPWQDLTLSSAALITFHVPR